MPDYISTDNLQNYYLTAGTASIIVQHSALVKITDSTDEVEESRTTCNKDTGEKRTLQKWTRGTWFCVGGGGHIAAWQPLYQ